MISDDFNRGNSGTLGANWTDVVAGMGISGNMAGPLSGSGYVFATYSGASWGNDHTSEAVVTLTTSDMELICRAQAGGDLYMLMVNTGGVTRFYKRVSGSYTQIGSDMAAPTDGHTYRLEVSGSSPTSLKAYDNGVQLGSTQTDSEATLQSGGAPGIGGSSFSVGYWDDWVGTGEVSALRFILGTH